VIYIYIYIYIYLCISWFNENNVKMRGTCIKIIVHVVCQRDYVLVLVDQWEPKLNILDKFCCRSPRQISSKPLRTSGTEIGGQADIQIDYFNGFCV